MLRCLKDCASRFRDVMILYKLVEVCVLMVGILDGIL
jgi:hypothetical protein